MGNNHTRPHMCYLCGKTFGQKNTLDAHILIHKGIKPFTCKVCSMSFGELGSLKRHRYKHTTLKPHQCKLCGLRFTQAAQIRAHTAKHHGNKVQRPAGDESGDTESRGFYTELGLPSLPETE